MILRSFNSTQCAQLRVLNLRRNEKIGEIPDGDYSFEPISHIEELDLSECCLSGEFVSKFFACLLADGNINPKLVALYIQDNPLKSNGFKALLPLITNSWLKQLNVSKCELDDDGIKCLETSKSSNYLHVLDLAHNNLSCIGAEWLAKGIESRSSPLFQLVELNLAGNNLGENGVQLLANALCARHQLEGSSKSLEKLDLTNTNCGTQGAIDIITKGNLKSLCLFNNSLGSDGFMALATAINGGHATLEDLDLGGNQANQAAVVVLLGALIEQNPQSEGVSPADNSLKLLVVGGNEGGDAVEQIAAKIQQVHPTLDIARDKKAQRQPE